MPDPGAMRETILNAAEKRIRSVGYNAVSFRDLAADVGVKSASIHYHFPQKADLGAQLVARYAERFAARLEAIDRSDLRGAIACYLALYGEALVVGEQICLCAMLGAETNGLPPVVNSGVGDFFRMNVEWLADLNERHGVARSAPSPYEVIAALEGAMIIATASGSRQAFDKVVASIQARYR